MLVITLSSSIPMWACVSISYVYVNVCIHAFSFLDIHAVILSTGLLYSNNLKIFNLITQ